MDMEKYVWSFALRQHPTDGMSRNLGISLVLKPETKRAL